MSEQNIGANTMDSGETETQSGGRNYVATLAKLIALAENAGTEHEAHAANEMVALFMARHNLSRAMAAAAGQTERVLTRKRIYIPDPHRANRIDLMFSIVSPFGVKAVNWPNAHKRNEYGMGEMELVGYEEDVQQCEVLFTLLISQTKRFIANIDGGKGERYAWFAGYNKRIKERLWEQYHTAVHEYVSTHESNGAELVIADKRTKVAKFYEEQFPVRGKPKTRRLSGIDGAGYSQGIADANRSDIGATRLNGRKAIE